jgi:hypothetical protein
MIVLEHLADKCRKDEVWAQEMLDSMTQMPKFWFRFHLKKQSLI